MIKEGDERKLDTKIKLENATYIFMICVATLMCLLLLAVLTLIIYSLSNLYKDKNLNLLYVATTYMEPEVQSNSFITYNEDYGTLKVGDIVIVEYSDGIYVQEITSKQVLSDRTYYSAKDTISERVFIENNVYGVYEKTLTTLTGFTRFCKSFWGIMVMIVIPFGMYVSFEIYFLVKKPKFKTTVVLKTNDEFDQEELLESKMFNRIKHLEQKDEIYETKDSELNEKK